MKCWDVVLKSKGDTDELLAALTHEKLGFKMFWEKDISPIVANANQAASIKMLFQYFKANLPQHTPAKNTSAPQGNQNSSKVTQAHQGGGQGDNTNQGGCKRWTW